MGGSQTNSGRCRKEFRKNLYNSKLNCLDASFERLAIRKRRISMCRRIIWWFNLSYALALLGVFVWYMVCEQHNPRAFLSRCQLTLMEDYNTDQTNPSAAVYIQENGQLAFPTMTFCITQSVQQARPIPIRCSLLL